MIEVNQKKIPLRKCNGCREMKDKRELMRVVRNDAGEFFIDPTGKKNGRGAFVCKNPACLEKAVKTRGFERSFKCRVPLEIIEKLRTEFEALDE